MSSWHVVPANQIIILATTGYTVHPLPANNDVLTGVTSQQVIVAAINVEGINRRPNKRVIHNSRIQRQISRANLPRIQRVALNLGMVTKDKIIFRTTGNGVTIRACQDNIIVFMRLNDVATTIVRISRCYEIKISRVSVGQGITEVTVVSENDIVCGVSINCVIRHTTQHEILVQSGQHCIVSTITRFDGRDKIDREGLINKTHRVIDRRR